MYFPISGVEVAWWVPPIVAFVISFFASMGGISGAVFILPFQMSVLGYVNPSVSATNQCYNIIAIPAGVYRYWKEGRLVRPLAIVVILGTLPGVLLGSIIRIKYLPDPKNFKIFVGFVLLYIGSKMFFDIIKSKKKVVNKNLNSQTAQVGKVSICEFNLRKIIYMFGDDEFTVPTFWLLCVSFIIGIIGGIYGIGGGAFIAPILVTFFGLPIYTVAGATLLGTFVTSIAGVSFYQILSYIYPAKQISPDWLLGFLFGIGGIVGIYCGARCQKLIPSFYIKAILIVVILFTALKYLKVIF